MPFIVKKMFAIQDKKIVGKKELFPNFDTKNIIPFSSNFKPFNLTGNLAFPIVSL